MKELEEFTRCAECGMYVLNGEYHPFTACVLFAHTHSSEKVQDMLRQVALYGYEAARKGVSLDDALRNVGNHHARRR
jgi:hypothetical protein